MDKVSPLCFRESYEGLPEAMREAGFSHDKKRRMCIVTDSNVAALYLDAVKEVTGCKDAFIFEAGEERKHLGTLSEIYAKFLDLGLDRKSVVFALGGGVTGDLAGFAAATYMRGTALVQLPTSLLAQVDAGVGGKTAVDFGGVKNLIGAFYQPNLVYMNLRTLDTLPQQEFISGMGEVVKHGLIGDGEYYKYLRENAEAIKRREPEVMREVVAGSCRIKAAVVEQDEKEQGLRETLNFGHCVGHAVESLSDYQMPHGHCVAIGMAAALKISRQQGSISEAEEAEAVALMQTFGLPTNTDYPTDAIHAVMQKDKKNQNGKMRVVLLEKIGKAYTDESIGMKWKSLDIF